MFESRRAHHFFERKSLIKKILIPIAVFLVLVFIAAGVLAHKAPDMLVQALEKSLGKRILIRALQYHFPGVFELEGFEIKETREFAGETSFSVDKIRLDVSSLSLSQRKLIISVIQVENAEVIVRKLGGKLVHAFSDAGKKETSSASVLSRSSTETNHDTLPLIIQHFILKNSHFKFIDYDIKPEGFVIALDNIDSLIEPIELPFTTANTRYQISANMPQGPDKKPARIEITGRTRFKTADTDAEITIQSAYVPYFQPYYNQMTQASIESASLDSHINLLIEHNDLTLTAEAAVFDLKFRVYGTDDQFFGLNPDEMFAFLKDRDGNLRFQIVSKWNIADPNLKPKDVIQKSIERSLKKTVIGNVGNILQKTLQKMGEQGLDKNKESIEAGIKKLKDIFKV